MTSSHTEAARTISSERAAKLRAIKTLHTVAWGIFAFSILAIPPLAWTNHRSITIALIAIVFAECLVLAANRMRCPLTDIAARYTDDRRDNFDIYLPPWLARRNKLIFGWLYVGALVLTFVRWM